MTRTKDYQVVAGFYYIDQATGEKAICYDEKVTECDWKHLTEKRIERILNKLDWKPDVLTVLTTQEYIFSDGRMGCAEIERVEIKA